MLREPRVLAVVGTCNEVLDGHEPLPEQCGPLAEADIVIEDAHNDERGDVMHGQDELDASIRVANRAIGQLAALGCRRREVELAHLHLDARSQVGRFWRRRAQKILRRGTLGSVSDL